MKKTIAYATVFLCLGLGSMGAVDILAQKQPPPRPPTLSVSESGTSSRKLSQGELNQLLDRLEREFSQIKTLWAEFNQDKHLEIFAEVVRAKGRCLFQSPDKVRFEITAPFQSVLIVNHNMVSKSEFIDGRWQKVDSGQQQLILLIIEHITSWIQGRFRDKENLYEIGAEQGKATKLILVPKNEGFRKHLQTIEIVLNQGEKGIKQITLREPGRDYTAITFTTEKRNEVISPDLFDPTVVSPTPKRL